MMNAFRDLPIRTKLLVVGTIAALFVAIIAIVGWRARTAIGETMTAAQSTVVAMDALSVARAEIRLIPVRVRDLQAATTAAGIGEAVGAIEIHVRETIALLDRAAEFAPNTPGRNLIRDARLAAEGVAIASRRSAALQSQIVEARETRLTPVGEDLERRTLAQLERARANAETESAGLPTQLDEARAALDMLRANITRFLLLHDPAPLAAARRAGATTIDLFAVAQRLAENPDSRAEIAAAARLVHDFTTLMEEIVGLTDSLAEIDATLLTPARTDAESAITDAYRHYAASNSAALSALVATSDVIQGGLALIAACAMIGMLLIGMLVHRTMTRPVLAIAQAMQNISEGRHDVVVPYIERGDEIGGLARAAGAFRSALVEIDAARAQLEQSLARQRAIDGELRRLALVVEQTSNAVMITDKAGRIDWVNRAFQDLTGFAAEEVVGRRSAVLLKETDTTSAGLRTMRGAIAAGRGFDVEILSRRRDGTPYWVAIRGTPILDASGAVAQYIAIGDDCTQRQLDQQRLEQALATEREVSEHRKRFVAIASHEFRTPLTIIDGAAQRLLRASPDTAPDKLAERIRAAVRRMTGLIDRMLYASSLESGRIKATLVPLDVLALLRAAVQRQLEIAKHFTIAVTESHPEIPIRGDTVLLEQIFDNLLSNAVRYSSGSTHVAIDARIDGDHVVIAITDHGIGIPPDELPEMFQRFFRASTAKGIAGTGIGLHFVKDLLAMHGGTIDVASILGKGSTFSVRIPLAVAQSGDASTRSAA